MSDISTSSPPVFRPLAYKELHTAATTRSDWLWHGFLAPGSLTMVTSFWKAGKTTLLALLLDRLGKGGHLAGSAVSAGRAVVVSEEDPALWIQRGERLNFGEHVRWLCRPFRGKPTPHQWQALIDTLADLRREQGIDLVAIDPLATFLPNRNENVASLMLEALLPFQKLTALGTAVLLQHHPRRQASVAGQMARGSGALSGHADILIEMQAFSESPTDRRRRLRGFSRFEETPRDRVIELNTEGTDYVSLGDFEEEAFGRAWLLVRDVLTRAPDKLTRRQILRAWPPDQDRPNGVTLWRWLARAVERGLIAREGTGKRSDPFRYWLPEQEAVWRTDPAWVQREQQRLTGKEIEALIAASRATPRE